MTSISKKEIVEMLSLRGEEQRGLHREAVKMRNDTIGNMVFFRGLIEVSNICSNDCYYCGIRKSNSLIRRYRQEPDTVLSIIDKMYNMGFTSAVIQSGERRDQVFIRYICDLMSRIKMRYPDMVITLSVGEQSEDAYKRFYKSGAERYLLRIETSNRDLYNSIHPEAMAFDERLNCIGLLQRIGFQTGTGVMINLPGQTKEDLAEDILFFRDNDIDMCGMGPYIPHKDVPLVHDSYSESEAVELALNMIASLRLVMPDINIAATTALECLVINGKELGLLAGANVVMPQFSPEETRDMYMLYDNKPVKTVAGEKCIEHLELMAATCDMTAVFDDPGNPVHYMRRTNGCSGRA